MSTRSSASRYADTFVYLPTSVLLIERPAAANVQQTRAGVILRSPMAALLHANEAGVIRQFQVPRELLVLTYQRRAEPFRHRLLPFGVHHDSRTSRMR